MQLTSYHSDVNDISAYRRDEAKNIAVSVKDKPEYASLSR
jgi:hypothetical protein